jgi:hypothetical protein
MKVYVVYTDWGTYEGCGEPEAVFSSRAAAALFIQDTDQYWKDNAEIIELPLDNIP